MPEPLLTGLKTYTRGATDGTPAPSMRASEINPHSIVERYGLIADVRRNCSLSINRICRLHYQSIVVIHLNLNNPKTHPYIVLIGCSHTHRRGLSKQCETSFGKPMEDAVELLNPLFRKRMLSLETPLHAFGDQH